MRVRSSQMVTSERSGEVCWSLQNSGPASRKTWRMANLRREVELVHGSREKKEKNCSANCSSYRACIWACPQDAVEGSQN